MTSSTALVRARQLLSPAARLVIAHRGDSGNAPENTLVAFERAVAAHADALELDVHLSADGVAVVIHDARVDRTTDHRGAVASYSLEQLQSMDAGWSFSPDGGASHPYRGTGVRISTLAEVLTAFPDTPFVVEIKDIAAQPATQRVLTDLRAIDRCLVGSFRRQALVGLPRPPFRTGAARSDVWRLYARSLAGFPPHEAAYDAIFATRHHRGFPIPLSPFLRAGRRLGIPVHLWVENDPATARRMWDLGVSGIITDVPELIGSVRS